MGFGLYFSYFPTFKTGDNSKPENYRGITITSNIGKLLNMALPGLFSYFF